MVLSGVWRVSAKGIHSGWDIRALCTRRAWTGWRRRTRFVGIPRYSELERTLRYEEEKNSEGVQYHEISITLHP